MGEMLITLHADQIAEDKNMSQTCVNAPITITYMVNADALVISMLFCTGLR